MPWSGRVAVYATQADGTKVWKLGYHYKITDTSPWFNDFSCNFTGAAINIARPPNTIDGYTLGSGPGLNLTSGNGTAVNGQYPWHWAYCSTKMVWYEIDNTAYTELQSKGSSHNQISAVEYYDYNWASKYGDMTLDMYCPGKTASGADNWWNSVHMHQLNGDWYGTPGCISVLYRGTNQWFGASLGGAITDDSDATHWIWYGYYDDTGSTAYFFESPTKGGHAVFKGYNTSNGDDGSRYKATVYYNLTAAKEDGVVIACFRRDSYPSGGSYSGYRAIHKKQLVQQPFMKNGAIWYRPTTVEVILGFDDPVATDGYVYIGPNQTQALQDQYTSPGPPIQYLQTPQNGMYFNYVKKVWHRITQAEYRITNMRVLGSPSHTFATKPTGTPSNRTRLDATVVSSSTTDIEVAWHRIPNVAPTTTASVGNVVWVLQYSSNSFVFLSTDYLIFYQANTGDWSYITVGLFRNWLAGRSPTDAGWRDDSVSSSYYAIKSRNENNQINWVYSSLTLEGVSNIPENFVYIFMNRTEMPPALPGTGLYWLYHKIINIWYAVDATTYIRIADIKKNDSINISNSPGSPAYFCYTQYIQNTEVTNASNTLSVGTCEVIKQRAGTPNITAITPNMVIWYKNSWQIKPENLLVVAYQVDGWAYYRAIDVYKIVLSQTGVIVTITNRVAVLTTAYGDVTAWQYGVAAPPSLNSKDFVASTDLSNYGTAPHPSLSLVSSNYVWVYNLKQLIWYEMTVESSWDVANSHTTSYTITYASSAQISSLPVVYSTKTGEITSQTPQGIEIIWKRAPENATKPIEQLTWLSQTLNNVQQTPANGMQVWSYDTSVWSVIYRKQVVWEPFKSGTSIMWRPNLAIEILGQITSANPTIPVLYTGSIRFVGTQKDNKSWTTGRQFLTGTNDLPSNFSFVLSNYDPTSSIIQQAPGSTVGSWVFHPGQCLWHEVNDELSYSRIQHANLVSMQTTTPPSISYDNSTPMVSMWQQNTCALDRDSGNKGSIEVLWYRKGGLIAPTVGSLKWAEQASGTCFGTPTTVFGAKATLSAYSFQRAAQPNTMRTILWTTDSWNTNEWRALDGDQILAEPFVVSGSIRWRPNTVDNIRTNAMVKNLSDPVTYTGYVYVLSTDFDQVTQWRLGRSYLDLSDLAGPIMNTPINFSAVLTNYSNTTKDPMTLKLPPTGTRIEAETGEIAVLPTGYYPVYHVGQSVWHQLDEESFVRVIQSETIASISYSKAMSDINNLLRQNTLSTDITQVFSTEIEMLFRRAGQIDTPAISTLSATTSTSVFTNSNPQLAFGKFSSLQAYQTTAAESQGIAAWIYASQKWVAFYKNQVFAEPFTDSNGNIQWRPNTAYQIWKSIVLSDPVTSTGRIVIPVDRGDGIYIWRLGRSYADFGRPRNYAATINNLDSTRLDRQIPPSVINGYQITGVWDYHRDKKIWCEMVQDSHKAIILADVTAPIDYYSDVMPTWTLQTKVLPDEGGFAPTGTIQVVWGVAGQPVPTKKLDQSFWIDGQTLFLDCRYPGSAFQNEIPNLSNGVFYTDGMNFRVLHSDQVILEPFQVTKDTIKWRVSTPEQLMSQTIIFHTGYAALFTVGGDGLRQWRLGRYGPSGLGTWGKAALFPSVLLNEDPNGLLEVQRPPNTIEGYTLSKDRLWVYHSRHRVWYETDLVGWQLILRVQTGMPLTIDYTIDKSTSSAVVPFCNMTIPMNPEAGEQPGGNIEVCYSRAGKPLAPAITTLNYSGTGTVSTEYIHPKYGKLKLEELIPSWNSVSKSWVSLLNNEIILESMKVGENFKGWTPTVAVSLLERGYSISDPISYNMFAVLHFSPDGSKLWMVGKPSVINYIDKRSPADFAASFDNMDPNGSIEVQLPPSTIGEYTLSPSAVWAFHISYKVWMEVDSNSWNRIKTYGNRSTINYETSIRSFPINRTRYDNSGKQYPESLELIVSRLPPDPPASNSLPYLGTSTQFQAYNHPIYGTSTNPMPVSNQGIWNAIYKDAVVQVYLPTNNLRFVISYAYAIDGVRSDAGPKLQLIRSQSLALMQNLLTTGTNLKTDMEKKLRILNPLLSREDSEQVNTLLENTMSALHLITQRFNNLNDQILANEQAIKDLTYSIASFDQLPLIWKSIQRLETNAGIQITNTQSDLTNITSFHKRILDLYTTAISGNMVPLATIKEILTADLNEVSIVLNNVSKSISFVSTLVRNASLEKETVTGELDSAMPTRALEAMNSINSDFTAMNTRFTEVNSSFQKFQSDLTQAKDDIPSLIQLQIAVLDFLGTPDDVELKANDIITQFQLIRDFNIQLKQYGATLTLQTKEKISLIEAGIQAIQAINLQLKPISLEVSNLLDSLSQLDAPSVNSLKTLYDLIAEYQVNGNKYTSQLSTQLNWGKTDTKNNLAKILAQNLTISALRETQQQYLTSMQTNLQDVQTKLNSTILSFYTPMCNWIQASVQVITDSAQKLQTFKSQIQVYQARANQAVSTQSTPTPVVKQAITRIGLYISSIDGYLSDSQAYANRCKAIYSTLDKSNFIKIKDGYLEVHSLLDTLNQGLINASSYVRQAAVEASIATTPPDPSLWSQLTDWVTGLFNRKQ